MTVALIGAPAGFEQQLEPLDGVRLRRRLAPHTDLIVCFLRRRAELERRLDRLLASLEPDGGLWLAWPKRSSGVVTDVNENLLREVVLPTGFVDNKVCAIDETWSGLRFVLRRENRDARQDRREG